MKVRRVVTGHTAEGKATVASDTMVDPITTALVPGLSLTRLWGGDTAPLFPDAGSARTCEQYFPPCGGFRFAVFTVPPESSQPSASDLDTPTRRDGTERQSPAPTGHRRA